MKKTMEQRILDKNDFVAPFVHNRSQCFYCDKNEAIGVDVQDCAGEVRHICFKCLDELAGCFVTK